MILFITSSFAATLMVLMCVLLVDLFVMALIYYWGLTFNNVVVVNTVIAIGLSVDYSAHIAHTYLVVKPPPACKTKDQKRAYKARTALSQMGSSVFHGGFSTFLAISVLGPSNSYVFEVFFKCWFGIIVFGMSNGFLLLPVVLSMIGPTDDLLVSSHDDYRSVSATSSRKDGDSTPPSVVDTLPIDGVPKKAPGEFELQKITQQIGTESEMDINDEHGSKVLSPPRQASAVDAGIESVSDFNIKNK